MFEIPFPLTDMRLAGLCPLRGPWKAKTSEKGLHVPG